MTTRAHRTAAAAGAVAALTSIITSLAVPAGVLSDNSSPAWNTIDLVTDVLLVAGLAGFAASGAARGRLARIGLSLAFAGLGVFALAAILGFSNADAGETLHPISVPLTGLGMQLTGVATIRTHRILFTAPWSASSQPTAEPTTPPVTATAASHAPH